MRAHADEAEPEGCERGRSHGSRRIGEEREHFRQRRHKQRSACEGNPRQRGDRKRPAPVQDDGMCGEAHDQAGCGKGERAYRPYRERARTARRHLRRDREEGHD